MTTEPVYVGLDELSDAADDNVFASHCYAYVVAFPHQCDAWVAVDEPTRDAALSSLDEFIASLQSARQRLAALPEGLPEPR